MNKRYTLLDGKREEQYAQTLVCVCVDSGTFIRVKSDTRYVLCAQTLLCLYSGVADVISYTSGTFPE